MSTLTTSRTLLLARREDGELPGVVRVTVVAGPDAGRMFDADLPTTIGRAEVAGVRLTDPTASAMHVELSGGHGGLRVRDLESANGTACGGVFLREATVPSGAELQIGTTLVRVDAAGAPSRTLEPVEFGRLRSSSASMRGPLALLARIAPTELSVLLECADPSESDLAAASIHEASAHADRPFATVDCEALATTSGALDETRDGTVYLRNVDALTPELQARLYEMPRGPRFLASTSRDLAVVLNRGDFHEDLYDRIAQVRARLPPLRERSEDVPAFVYAFLQALPADRVAARAVTKETMQLLRRREWLGGVRELHDVVERAALIAPGPTIVPADLAFERVLERARFDVDTLYKDAKRTLLDDFERAYLTTLMARHGDNLSRASIAAGVERHHLRQLLRKHGLRGADGA